MGSKGNKAAQRAVRLDSLSGLLLALASTHSARAIFSLMLLFGFLLFDFLPFIRL